MKGKILHLYDETGWTLDVPCSPEKWELYKRAARSEHMKVADWLMKAIELGVNRILERSQ